jgi:DNA-binding MarR family transcriptional regulator
MLDKSFFKPTNLYKEYMILDLIEKNKDITQRELASHLSIAVSMVNLLLDRIEKEGFAKRKKYNSKKVEYILSKKGIERRKLLNIWYLKSSQDIYLSAKDNIFVFIHQIISKGYKKILLYGAGEVAEIFIRVLNENREIPLEVLAVIDDNTLRQDQNLLQLPIILKESISEYEHDGILISSYTHHLKIKENLLSIGYDKNKMIHFFDNE